MGVPLMRVPRRARRHQAALPMSQVGRMAIRQACCGIRAGERVSVGSSVRVVRGAESASNAVAHVGRVGGIDHLDQLETGVGNSVE